MPKLKCDNKRAYELSCSMMALGIGQDDSMIDMFVAASAVAIECMEDDASLEDFLKEVTKVWKIRERARAKAAS